MAATVKKGSDIEVGDYLHGEDGRVTAVWEADDEWVLTELEDGRTRAVGQDEDVTVSTGPGYCTACGGEGWLPSRPEGDSECPYCEGTGGA